MRSRNPRAADRSANHPIVFGAPYSGYVRAVRLALEEKDVRYELVPIDTFAPGGAPPEHQVRHPFGKIRAFEYAGFSLYEAGAITRFVDEVFPGPSLQPDDARARVNQIISILDSYAYPTLVWDIYVERVSRPAGGASSDEQRISAAMPKAKVCLSALSEFMDGSPWLTGSAISLADLHAAPIFAVFRLAPEGSRLLAEHVGLLQWWGRVSSRQSFFAPRCRRATSRLEPKPSSHSIIRSCRHRWPSFDVSDHRAALVR